MRNNDVTLCCNWFHIVTNYQTICITMVDGSDNNYHIISESNENIGTIPNNQGVDLSSEAASTPKDIIK